MNRTDPLITFKQNTEDLYHFGWQNKPLTGGSRFLVHLFIVACKKTKKRGYIVLDVLY